jgi:hypothetical protein
MLRSYLSLLCLLLIAVTDQTGEAAAKDVFAIVGVNVIPMDAERVLEAQTVIVADGVIQSISATAATTLPSDLRQIAGSGRYLMPGLADMHIHLARKDELVNYLAWGVTTVMHLGGSTNDGKKLLDYREQVKRGSLLGPNIYTTDRILDGDPPVASNALSIATQGKAREAVRKLKVDGFDFAKIYNNVSQATFNAIVDEAGKQNLPVFGHIPRGFDPLLALSGGQNAVVHTEEFFFTYFDGPRSTRNMLQNYAADLGKLPALLEVLVENEVAVMPDLSFTFTNLLMWDNLDHIWNDAEFAYLHPASASMWEGGNINRRTEVENHIRRDQWKYDLMQRLTQEFQKAGVLQVIGTDASLPGLYPGAAVHRELTELVKAGISNFDALAIGSRNAGEFARRYLDSEVRVGLIAPGYRADFVLLEKNPLEDVRNARSVSAVAVNGRFTTKAELDIQRSQLRQRYDMLRSVNSAVDTALLSAEPHDSLAQLVKTNGNDVEILKTIESRINSAGYAAAFADDLDRSEQLLELNTQLFSTSANTWDSLAEIVDYRGDSIRALQLYRKVMQIDPEFGNARENVERIENDTQE